MKKMFGSKFFLFVSTAKTFKLINPQTERHSSEIDKKDIAMYATWSACTITRTSSKLAFSKYGRSVLTSHILEEIGTSYDQFMKQ